MPSFTYRKVCKKLKRKGFHFYRQASGSHEIWINDKGIKVTVSNHPDDFPTGTVSNIAKQAGFKNLHEFEKF